MLIDFLGDTTLAERFSRRPTRDTNGCREWLGRRDKNGYGLMNARKADGIIRPVFAHRVAYALAFGSFAAELSVCHHCDNPSCVNPAHLFLGTRKDNMRDCAAKGRVWSFGKGATHCKRGHEFTPENVRLVKTRSGGTGRQCKRCEYERVTASRKRNPEPYREANRRFRARQKAITTATQSAA